MAETINISTYELLVKPIIDNGNPPNRTVIQGYFLTIANPSLSDLQIQLTFTAATPDFTSSDFVAFWDVDGENTPLTPEPILSFVSRTYLVDLPSLDTGLFLFLPNVEDSEIISNRETEIRGYVRLSIPSATPVGLSNNRTILLSPQQRGTFLPQGTTNPPEVGDFDQFTYSLPLATGGSEVTLVADLAAPSPEFEPALRQVISDAIENDPGLISKISSDDFAQMLSGLNPDEQRQMLKLFLERADVQLAVAR